MLNSLPKILCHESWPLNHDVLGFCGYSKALRYATSLLLDASMSFRLHSAIKPLSKCSHTDEPPIPNSLQLLPQSLRHNTTVSTPNQTETFQPLNQIWDRGTQCVQMIMCDRFQNFSKSLSFFLLHSLFPSHFQMC